MASAFMVDVGRTGILFSTEVAVETIAKVLVMRDGQPEVDRYHDGMRATTTPRVVMPMDMQKSLQKQALDIWVKENPDVKRVLDGKGCSRTVYARTARMLYRRACFKLFGGQEWMYFLIAVGGINPTLIACAKQASTELVEAKKRKVGDAWNAPEDWQPAASQRRQLAQDRAASASSAGPRFNAVEHNVAKSKELRANGRILDKQIAKEQAAYVAHRSNMSVREWDNLLSRAEQVWEDAQEASEAAGVEYTDREGNICCKRNQNDTWVGRTLSYYQRAVRDNI